MSIILEPSEILHSSGLVLKNKSDIPLIMTETVQGKEFTIETYPINASYELKIISAKIIIAEIKPFVSRNNLKKILRKINKRLGIKLRIKDV